MKQREFHTQRGNQWGCTQLFGRLMIGRLEVALKRLIGAKPHFWLTTGTLILKAVVSLARPRAHRTGPIGGKELHTSHSQPSSTEGTNGSVWTTWSMTTVPTGPGTRCRRRSVSLATKTPVSFQNWYIYNTYTIYTSSKTVLLLVKRRSWKFARTQHGPLLYTTLLACPLPRVYRELCHLACIAAKFLIVFRWKKWWEREGWYGGGKKANVNMFFFFYFVMCMYFVSFSEALFVPINSVLSVCEKRSCLCVWKKYMFLFAVVS